MTVNNTDSEEIAETEEDETPDTSIEMDEVEAHEETACLTLVGETAENIGLLTDIFNQSSQKIVEIAVSDPKRYLTMLEAARKLTK